MYLGSFPIYLSIRTYVLSYPYRYIDMYLGMAKMYLGLLSMYLPWCVEVLSYFPDVLTLMYRCT
jgi:hypothetical protein